MTEVTNGKRRYSNRKFSLAVATLVVASAVMLGLVIGHGKEVSTIMPVLWWWAGIDSSVLALYGATNVLDKIAARGRE